MAALVHERKSKLDHEVFWAVTRKNLDLSDRRGVMVTDREFIHLQTLDGCQPLACWNHLKDNVTRKADSMGAKGKEDQAKISQNFHALLMSTTPETFHQRIQDYYHGVADVHSVWQDPLFQTYFDDNINEVLESKASRWVIEDAGLDSRNGITSNVSESLNSQFKQNHPGVSTNKIWL